MLDYINPRRRRTRSSGLPANSQGLSVLGIEVTQTIQDLQNSVPLVADKGTIVRLYLDASLLKGARRVTGEITWRRDVGSDNYLPAFDHVRLNPKNILNVNQQRHDLSTSLNFRLPPEATREGALSIDVHKLSVLGGDDIPFVGSPSIAVDFQSIPSLIIRVVGFRYRDVAKNTFISPGAIHFDYLRSYLKRAYPVARVQWSQIVVDANFTTPFNDNTSTLANAQLAAFRNREVSAGFDPRTHYYGVVDDANRRNFMRGRAFFIPDQPRPDTVASGPVGVPNGFLGDHDASYSDWYGAHELGHTFGRRHPGYPLASQGKDDSKFPYPKGQISFDDDRYVGFDIGDPSLNLPMAALPGKIHHDVMTYGDKQWLSAYTYNGIMQRLIDEAALTS